ncbi:uncharacterized protein [Primulina huaijiensis]|uniref:uncharacterized protein isoform X2 n=1 Tax=Primulina huaijiensis TaxID=1492673 RepID=UPI003CC76439
MAGMLPGVEAARRRRFSQTRNSNHGGNSSLCLYERNHGFHISSSYLMRSSIGSQEECDQSLDTVAREAKKRLDERLNSAHLKSDIKRSLQCQEGTGNILADGKTKKCGCRRGYTYFGNAMILVRKHA